VTRFLSRKRAGSWGGDAGAAPDEPRGGWPTCNTVSVPAQAWVTLIVGSVAAIGVIITWQQQNRADRRAEWWRRAQWAFERTFSDDDRQTASKPRSLEVRKAAARAVVAASAKTGDPVDPVIQALADS